MNDRIPLFLLSQYEAPARTVRGLLRRPFVDQALDRIGSVIKATFVQWEFASKKGLLQSVDGRVKLVCLTFLLVVATLKNDMLPLLLLSCFLFLLAALSRLSLPFFYRRVCALAFLFGPLIALPAAINLVTPGRVVLPLVTFGRALRLGFFVVPPTVGVTAEGLTIVARLTLRSIACLSASFLLLYTTPLPQIVRSLKVFRVPDTVLVVLFLTYKYVFVFSAMLEDMYLAVRSRLPGPLSNGQTRAWSAGRGAVLFHKTQTRCEDLFQAMTSRGLAGDIALSESGSLRTVDVACGLGLAAIGGLLLWM